MAGIHQGTQTPEYDESRRSEVTAVIEVKTLAVAYTNAEGKKGMWLALVYAKENDDGGPGVFIMAEQEQMGQQLNMAGKIVKSGVRKWIDADVEPGPVDIPKHLSVGGAVVPSGTDVGAMEVGE